MTTKPPTHLPAYTTHTMQVIRLTTTDGISHEFFGPSLLRNDQNGQLTQMAHITVNFGPELTIQQVQEILAYHASDLNPATDRSLN
jgi:hypothetical protein